MDLEEIRTYCISKKGVTEAFPFDESTLVFKVMGKIFLLTDTDKAELSVNLKCEPEQAVIWREQFASVRPGFHMNKKYWNTVDFNGELSNKLFLTMIDHSYDEVVKGLPKKTQLILQELP